MAENVEVLLRLRGSRQFVSQATQSALATEKIGDAAEKSGGKMDKAAKNQEAFSGAMGKLKGVAMLGVTALGVAGAAATAMGVKYNMGMEQTQVAFTQFLGSGDKANAMIKRLQELNKSTPFEFPELAGVTKRMLAMGFSAEDAVKHTKMLTDAVAGIGGGGAELDRASLALGQISSKGKLMAEDLAQLTELGIVGLKDMGKQFGMTGGEFSKAMSKGEISSEEALAAISAITKSNFGGAAAAQSKTFAGQLSNLKDAFSQMLGQAMMPVFEFLRDEAMPALASATPTLTKLATTLGVVLVGAFKALIAVLRPVVTHWQTIKTVLTALMPVFVFFGTLALILKTVAIAMKLVAIATGAWNALLAVNPIFLIIAGVIALVAALVLAYQKVGWFRKAVQAVWGWIKSNWRLLVVLIAGPIGAAILLVIKHWDKIKPAVKPIIDWLVGALGTVVDAIKAVGEWIGRLPWDKVGKVIGAAGKIAGGVLGGANRLLGGKADGGPVTRSGSYVVGERGPEVVSLRAGSTVFPTPAIAGGFGGSPSLEPRQAQEIVTKVYIGKRQVAEAVGEYLAGQKARK